MADSVSSAAAWARVVSEDEPHDLDDLESQVLGRGQVRPAPRGESVGGTPLTVVRTIFWACCILGPLLAATAMWDRSDSLQLPFYFADSVAFPLATAGFGLGCVFLVATVVTWSRAGRHRENTTVTLSAFTAALAVVTLLLAGSRDGDSGPAPTAVYLVPVYLALVLGLVVALLVALSPASDPADADEWQRRRQLHNARTHVALHGIDALSPPSVQILLEDRREALVTLRSRGLLDPQMDVEGLSRRPLGQLSSPGLQDDRP